MSTRYVYADYNTAASQYQQTKIESLETTNEYDYVGAIVCNSYEASIAYNRQGKPVTKYINSGDGDFHHISTSETEYVADTSKYKYLILYRGTARITNADVILSDCYLLEFDSNMSGSYWHTYAEGGIYSSITAWTDNYRTNKLPPEESGLMPFYKRGGLIEKGNLSRYESSKSKNLTEGAYSTGKGFGWREYQGPDSIDPSAVSYSVNDLYSDEPFKIIVTPRTPTYGGTVYYQYQYSLNGGSNWTNIGGKTTGTSATVTIPEGAEQFRARVLSSDGWGFTSSTYVYGPAKEVSQLKAYVGIGGKAVALKKGYVGFGGKAVELVKGYVGVGGFAKKLF